MEKPRASARRARSSPPVKQWITPFVDALLLQQRRRLVVRLAGVDDDGQVELAGQTDLGPEHLALDVPRRVVVVEVEADLADGHDALFAGEAAQLVVDGGGCELASWGWTPADTGSFSSSATRRARRWPASSSTPPMSSIVSTPAARARSRTAGRSSSKAGMSMWQWESATAMAI